MKFIIFFLVIFTQVCYAIDVHPVNFIEIISFSKIFWTILFLIISYIFITLLTKIIEFFAEKSSRLRISIKGVVPILRIGLWIAVITIVIKVIYNPPIEMLMTAMASVAIAIGFATQDLLKNIFGGIMLLFDRPFKVGDKIKVGDNYGEVITINLQTTRIVTPDDSIVIIPNMELMNSRISNSNSGELYCQVVAKIALPVDADMQKVRKTAIEAAQVSKYIYLNKPITVLFTNEINEHKIFLEMKLKAYVMDIRYEFLFKSDMTEVVIKELINQGLLNNNEIKELNFTKSM
ncbi:mechanosensitive ion channel family protein [Candidatus Sulfurimonas baltica]|uniref:Mechanosensitive ion channel n=1 Tax=Candidatus Sulfurimonas baltica TaxID=2740404 RepID=A0A7S7LVD3_9BACT|nr:mechanosensitive ion channel domain-containing protein [Candidatus Sulfurimonas baltica]QOY51982.1 mechanosensitive ion channel [Candidatus Sulfurimonas baltica]